MSHMTPVTNKDMTTYIPAVMALAMCTNVRHNTIDIPTALSQDSVLRHRSMSTNDCAC